MDFKINSLDNVSSYLWLWHDGSLNRALPSVAIPSHRGRRSLLLLIMIPVWHQTARSFLRAQRVGLKYTSFNAKLSSRTIVTKWYTKEHELISYNDETSIGRLHITNHAAESLGDVVFVELPKLEREVAQGDQIGAVESVKAASDIYAPVSGKVIEINEELGGTPGLMNKEPETAGWLCDLQVSKPDELKSLMTEEAYESYCSESA